MMVPLYLGQERPTKTAASEGQCKTLVSLEQQFSTCGSNPFLLGGEGCISDIYIMMHKSSKVSFEVATKYVYGWGGGHRIKGVQR